MKKVKFIILFLTITILLGGCGNNIKSNSPESVALDMAKRLSEGNYDNIEELIYSNGEIFIDDESFKNYLSSNYLNIEGNEKTELVESDTETTEEITNKVIKIRLDDNKVLSVNMIKKEDKWYVNLNNNMDSNLIIKVPSGSTVTLNNTKLDFSKYGKTEQMDRSVAGEYDYKQTIDIYTISNLFEGDYDLKVENELIETINTKIKSNRSYYYNEDEIFNSQKDAYVIFSLANSTKTNEVKEFLNEYYTNIINAATEKKEFSEISKYFASESTEYSTYEANYKKFIESFEDTSYTSWIEYFSDIKTEITYPEEDYCKVTYVDKNNYIITAKVKMSYTSTKKYQILKWDDKIENETIEKIIVLDVIKNEDGSYKIKNGLKVIPSFSKYEYE